MLNALSTVEWRLRMCGQALVSCALTYGYCSVYSKPDTENLGARVQDTAKLGLSICDDCVDKPWCSCDEDEGTNALCNELMPLQAPGTT